MSFVLLPLKINSQNWPNLLIISLNRILALHKQTSKMTDIQAITEKSIDEDFSGQKQDLIAAS